MIILTSILQFFQRVWSARVVDERAAWELLSLCDQIRLWAITDFRTFILEHLTPWHKFCDDNYILDWNSVYDTRQELKWTRTCSDTEDLSLPSWANLLSETARQKVQARAKQSLTRALEEHRARKGKGRCQDDSGWHCIVNECSKSVGTHCGSDQAFLDHLRGVHHYQESTIEKIYLCINGREKMEKEEREEIEGRERREKGKGKERLNDSAVETHTRNSKRCFDEEERLSDDSQDLFSDNDPGPSKRVKVAYLF